MAFNETTIIVVVAIVSLAPVIWSVIDVANRTDAEFVSAPGTRTLWLVLPILLLPVGLGWLAAAIYLLGIRTQLVPSATADTA